MMLVLSLFPGIGLLDMAFEEEGFCVVRGPDLLWGGDVCRFHVPSGRFDGIIGGPPCQAHSRLRHIVEANGYQVAPCRIAEFERVIAEAQPDWFVMENVEAAPVPVVPGYQVHAQFVRDHWCGGATERKRRFSFGTTDGQRLRIETLALHTIQPERAVTCDARAVPVKLAPGGKPKGQGGRLPRTGPSMRVAEMAELQGLPSDFLSEAPFTESAKRKVIGNGVPLPMGRAIARAVKRAVGMEAIHVAA